MTRINRPDTLLTELRDIKRRLRLLEAGRMRPPATGLALDRPTVPLLPIRPIDWPATGSSEWEALSSSAAAAGVVELRAVADPGTTGAARVLVDGVQVGEDVAITEEPGTTTISVPVAQEIVVEARSSGPGQVRVTALLAP